MKSKLTILLAGTFAAAPHTGGVAWVVLQYWLGLRRLGHDVYFVEPLKPQALRPIQSPLAASANADYFHLVTSRFSLTESAALLLEGTRQTFGLAYPQLKEVARRADLLINISGMLTEEELLEPIPRRIYLDLDPGFNQLWHTVQGIDMRYQGHTHFVTIGLDIGQAGCPVPTCGLNWITTWQPVVLEHWPAAPLQRITCNALTTVGHWRGYGSINYAGTLYGQKAHSLRPLFELPKLTRERFSLAMGIHADERKDLEALAANGWQLLDAAHVADTPAHYQEFIQSSKAEFGIAKSGYVYSRCGWFSDRSVCYLASGRPVLAQETGFSRYFPVGEGLFSFKTCQDVLAGIEEMNRDYPGHARKAREIAEEYFDSDKVLQRLLDRIGTKTP